MRNSSPAPLDVEAAAVGQLKAQHEAFMARAKTIGAAEPKAGGDDLASLSDYDQQSLGSGTFQIRGSVQVSRAADLRAQLVAIRNAVTEALLILDRPAAALEKRILIRNKMTGAGKACTNIRRAAGEDWAK